MSDVLRLGPCKVLQRLEDGVVEQDYILASDYDDLAAENAALKARLAEAERDATRLQWLADNPRGAQIVVDGKTQDCVLWGISADPRITLREAIDAAIDQPPASDCLGGAPH